MKILIAEDDFASRIVIQKMLSTLGTCDVVINGQEAVNAYELAMKEGDPYDLICLDIMMPEMDGREALKIIRQKESELKIAPKKETKIIMVTALDTPKDVMEAFFLGGCSSYLVKPVEKKKLHDIIKELGLLE